MASDPPRIVDTKRVYTGWNTFDIVTVEAPDADGNDRRHKREVVDHGDAAVGAGRSTASAASRFWSGSGAPACSASAPTPYLLEACAGILDPGETPEEAARREAEEEIGLKVGDAAEPRQRSSRRPAR